MKLAEIYEAMGDPKKALGLVYQGKREGLNCVMTLMNFPSVIDARKRAKVGKQGGLQPSTSTTQADQGINRSLFDEKATAAKKSAKPTGQRLSPVELKALEQERQKKLDAAHEMCKQLYNGMMAGDKEAESEWLIEAEQLVEHFRETRQLFITSKVI
jgi:general transcription factor 3C polypeptide 3 (transcription factor C subunit 4)